jgi:hypothetical protein
MLIAMDEGGETLYISPKKKKENKLVGWIHIF